MSWDNAVELANQGGGEYLKLENDGDTVTGIFVGEPEARQVVWTGTTYEEYDEDVHQDARPAFKFKIGFYDTKDGVMKTWESGKKSFNAMCKLRASGELDGHVVRIKRLGTGKDTVYDLESKGAADEATLAKAQGAPF